MHDLPRALRGRTVFLCVALAWFLQLRAECFDEDILK